MTSLLQCLQAVKGWMGGNGLKQPWHDGMALGLGRLVHRDLPPLVLRRDCTAPDCGLRVRGRDWWWAVSSRASSRSSERWQAASSSAIRDFRLSRQRIWGKPAPSNTAAVASWRWGHRNIASSQRKRLVGCKETWATAYMEGVQPH